MTLMTNLADRLREKADLIGQRLISPDRVVQIAADPANVDPVYGAVLWMPNTLSHGFPGVATFLGELARDDACWRPAAHEHLALATSSLSGAPANGLFAGPSAVLAAAQTCAADGGYQVLRNRLVRWQLSDQLTRIESWRQRRADGAPGVGWSAYDTVNGLSGTSQLLLDALSQPDCPSRDEIVDTLRRTMEFLSQLTEPIRVDGQLVPGWWIPAELQPTELDRVDYPQGDFNLGLAHGIPAALAVLARAHLAGFETAPAVERITNWVLRWRAEDECGSYWPARVSWSDECGESKPATDFTRSAWCYGAPGIAVALHAAGIALDNADWRDEAVSALHSVLRRNRDHWRLEGATLCHGYAGLMSILLRVGWSAADPGLIDGAVQMAEPVLDFCDPDSPFGVCHLVPDSAAGWRQASSYRALNVAGLLEGSAGVGCALLDLARHCEGSGAERPSSWARAMMLA